MSDDPLTEPRGKGGRAPDVFRPGGLGADAALCATTDEVDFLVVGTGAGGGTLACRLAEAGFSVVGLDAGPWFRPLEDFASDEAEQTKLYWTDDRISDRREPGAARFEQQRQGGWRQHRAFRDGVAALPAGVVQVAQSAGVWRGLAGRLAGDVVGTMQRSNRR